MFSNFLVCKSILLISLLLFTSFSIGAEKSNNNIMASGEGFVVDEAYVKAMESFYESAGYTTTKDQYIKQAVKIKVFSQEARSIGLEPQSVNVDHYNHDPLDPVKMNLIEDIGLAEAFVTNIIKTYPVDGVIIESYYRSNPMKFRKDFQDNSTILSLDAELKQVIKSMLLNPIKDRIADEFYSGLKEKYEIQTEY